jgi:hypothetical protein
MDLLLSLAIANDFQVIFTRVSDEAGLKVEILDRELVGS